MTIEMKTARLRAVVEAYGADPKRWPDAERHDLEAVVANAGAPGWLDEAKMLDAAMGAAMPGALSADLRARILKSAASTSQMTGGNEVVDLTAIRSAKRASLPSRRFGGIPEMAVLAASLLVGMWAGGSGMLETTFYEFDVAVGIGVEDDAQSNLIDALEGISPAVDEELL